MRLAVDARASLGLQLLAQLRATVGEALADEIAAGPRARDDDAIAAQRARVEQLRAEARADEGMTRPTRPPAP
jgi:hypothetical protein